jgi:hypothetical protein
LKYWMHSFTHVRSLGWRAQYSVLCMREVILGAGVDGKRGGVLSRYTFENVSVTAQSFKVQILGLGTARNIITTRRWAWA